MPSAPSSSALLIVTTPTGDAQTASQHLFEPSLSPDAAAMLAAAFVSDVVHKANALPGRARIAVAVAPPSGAQSAAVTLSGRTAFPETGNPGTDPPVHTMERAFEAGYQSVCIVGPDTPHLPFAFVLEAFGRLARHPDTVVLGPTDDGGCYLMGAAGRTPRALLERLSWEKSALLPAVLEQALAQGVTVTLLPPWYRVYTPPGMQRLRRDLERGVVVAPETQRLLREREVAAPGFASGSTNGLDTR